MKVAYELGAIVLEIVRIPLRVWLRAAEVAGAVVLRLWRGTVPILAALGRVLRRAVAVSARVVTPARTAIFVALFAAAALAASQFVHYRAIEIGAHAYRGVAGVAPPPQVDAATPQSAHGEWLVMIAAVAIAILFFAGQAGVAYQGARATLLRGFAAEVAAGGLLAFSGVLIALSAPATARGRSRGRMRVRRRRRGTESRRRPPRPSPRTTPRKASG
jgi:hypothetical protein